MITDPIADMLTIMRNGLAVNKTEVRMPFSRLKNELARLLKDEGYISAYEKEENNSKPQLKVVLKYENGSPVIHSLKKISKPGRRIYRKKNELPIVLNNYGLAVVSTPKGLLTNHEAKKLGLGGEVICEIY